MPAQPAELRTGGRERRRLRSRPGPTVIGHLFAAPAQHMQSRGDVTAPADPDDRTCGGVPAGLLQPLQAAEGEGRRPDAAARAADDGSLRWFRLGRWILAVDHRAVPARLLPRGAQGDHGQPDQAEATERDAENEEHVVEPVSLAVRRVDVLLPVHHDLDDPGQGGDQEEAEQPARRDPIAPRAAEGGDLHAPPAELQRERDQRRRDDQHHSRGQRRRDGRHRGQHAEVVQRHRKHDREQDDQGDQGPEQRAPPADPLDAAARQHGELVDLAHGRGQPGTDHGRSSPAVRRFRTRTTALLDEEHPSARGDTSATVSGSNGV